MIFYNFLSYHLERDIVHSNWYNIYGTYFQYQLHRKKYSSSKFKIKNKNKT